MGKKREGGAPAAFATQKCPTHRCESPPRKGGSPELTAAIDFAGITPESYRRRFKMGKVPVLRLCPACGGRLHKHGVYKRHMTSASHPWQELAIQRMICRACRVTVSLLPGFLKPYQSLVSALREHLVQGRLRGRACGAWLKRWGAHKERSSGC